MPTLALRSLSSFGPIVSRPILEGLHHVQAKAALISYRVSPFHSVFNANIVSALMTRRFGEGWWVGGKLRLSFVNVIWGGDSVSAHVAVNEVMRAT
jgi:hypothetical protein